MRVAFFLIAWAIPFYSNSAPVFDASKIGFLYTEQDLGLTSVATVDLNSVAFSKGEVFGALPGSYPVNSGTQLNSEHLGYDINNLGIMWLTSNLDLYAKNILGEQKPVKLIDGTAIAGSYQNPSFDEVAGLFSYGLDYGTVQDDIYLGSPYPHPNLPPVESYVYGDVQSLNDFSIDCLTLNTCGYDIAGMQYFDSKDDTYLNGDLFYLSKDENGLIKDSSIFAYNLGVNERRTAFTFSELGITQDIAPTRGFTFFNRDILAIPGTVSVPEPSALYLMVLSVLCLSASRILKRS